MNRESRTTSSLTSLADRATGEGGEGPEEGDDSQGEGVRRERRWKGMRASLSRGCSVRSLDDVTVYSYYLHPTFVSGFKKILYT
jgi:hypothetical protein